MKGIPYCWTKRRRWHTSGRRNQTKIFGRGPSSAGQPRAGHETRARLPACRDGPRRRPGEFPFANLFQTSGRARNDSSLKCAAQLCASPAHLARDRPSVGPSRKLSAPSPLRNDARAGLECRAGGWPPARAARLLLGLGGPPGRPSPLHCGAPSQAAAQTNHRPAPSSVDFAPNSNLNSTSKQRHHGLSLGGPHGSNLDARRK